MFSTCKNIIDVDLSSFEHKNITNLNYMFGHCISLKSIKDINNWDT